MTMGASEKKKLGWLIGLGVVAAYLVYTNLLAGPEAPPDRAAASVPTALPVSAPASASTTTGRSGAPKRAGTVKKQGEEFHPVWRDKRPENRPDPWTVDPALNLHWLAKLKEVEPSANGRNLFQFGAPPKEPDKKLPTEPVVQVARFVGPKYIPPPPPAQPPPPPPPRPVPYKYYGYATARVNGKRTAFFLDGDEIFLAKEGDVLKKRFRIVRLNATSVVMEDMDDKRQQTVPLAEEAVQS
jgi:hypothetical protein